MTKKYRITKIPSDICETHFYGAKVGDVIKISNLEDDCIWANKSDTFTEEGWEGLKHYCVSTDIKSFLEHVEEIV